MSAEGCELALAAALFLIAFLLLCLFAYLLLQLLTPENLMRMGYEYFRSVLNHSIPRMF